MDKQLMPSRVHEETFFKIAYKVRCPTCQGQSIAESDSPSAIKLRSEIIEKLSQGQSEQQIMQSVADQNHKVATVLNDHFIGLAVLLVVTVVMINMKSSVLPWYSKHH